MIVAAFISPHGYGHAARAAAVMSAIYEADPRVRFEVFTATPRWFFTESMAGPFTYHRVWTDVGMAQTGPFGHDPVETAKRLDRFLPFDAATVEVLAHAVRSAACRLVLCDIAPMGIAVARAAGIPSVLVENFTWDWIYEGFTGSVPELLPHVDYLKTVFAAADYHIQTGPVCRPETVDLTTGPVSRKPRVPAARVRSALGIPCGRKTVMVTLGGIDHQYVMPERLSAREDAVVIVPGAADAFRAEGNFRLLPKNSGFYHPDLVRACDAVIGKVGYSTLAETYHAGVPFGYIPHAGFRESTALEAFISRHMAGIPLTEADLKTGRWANGLGALLSLPRRCPGLANGADPAAAFILGLAVDAPRT